MDIENFIKKEAPSESEHDKCYAKALREVYVAYQGKSEAELIELQKLTRIFYKIKGPTHYAVASCMVLRSMIGEYKQVTE